MISVATPFRLFLGVTALLTVQLAEAQDVAYRLSQAKIDRVMVKHQREGKPGGILQVVREGKVVYEKAFGLASLEHQVPIKRSTAFKISYGESREFMVFAVAALAGQGKLSFDDPVRKHIPELPQFASGITIRHLLNHGSGLYDYGAQFILAGWQMKNPLEDSDFFRLLSRQRHTAFAPGGGFMYSNTDYALLAFIVARVSGKSMHEFCEEVLFTPLGMISTLIDEEVGIVVKERAYQYADWSEGRSLLIRREKTSPAGRNGVITTIEDVGKWARAFNDPNSVLSKMLPKLMDGAVLHPDREGHYSFGRSIIEYRGLGLIAHQGIDDQPWLVEVPNERVAITLLVNGQTSPWDVVHSVLDELFFDGQSLAKTNANLSKAKLEEWNQIWKANPNGVATAKADLEKYAGSYSRRSRSRGRDFICLVKDGILVSPWGEYFDPLVPLGNGVFGYFSMLVQFTVLSDGGMEMKQYNRETGNRLEDMVRRPSAPKLSANDAAQLAGRYYNHELNVTWQVRAVADTLLLTRERMQDTPLSPSAKDAFDLMAWTDPEAYSTDYDVRFHRDEGGKVTHFTIQSGRIRGLEFLRLTDTVSPSSGPL